MKKRVVNGDGRGQGVTEVAGRRPTVPETFIFTRSSCTGLRWYNSCLRDYLFSLKRLSVGGWDPTGTQGRGVVSPVQRRLLILLRFCSCSVMIQRK